MYGIKKVAYKHIEKGATIKPNEMPRILNL
jgi:hypothetical protein